MGTIWVKEFTGGLDTRRLPETTPPGVLIRAKNGHVTRGGEFEKRAAFVPTYDLPANTVGLAHTRTGLVVFGHQPAPTMPPGVTYQRLQHPFLEAALASVPSYDLYDGKIYAVGVFADGSTYHFYDGVYVADWFDGRARASFNVLSGNPATATSAIGSLTITGGTLGAGVGAGPWDLPSAADTGVSFSTDAQESLLGAVAFSADGTRMYVVGNGTDRVYQYTLSTAWNIGTASYSGTSFSVAAQESSPAGLAFSADGTRMFIVGTANQTAYQYTLSTAWDVGTVSYSGLSVFLPGGQTASLAFRPDGLRMYYTSFNTFDVRQFSLSAAWDLSTATNDSISFVDGLMGTAVPTGVAFKSDGTRMYLTYNSLTDNIRQYSLSTPWNVGTAVYNGKSITNATPPGDVVFKPDGSRMYTAQLNDRFVYQYGFSSGANAIQNIDIGGLPVIGPPVSHTGNNSTTAAQVAAAINSFVSAPDYSATSDGAVVTISTVASGGVVNGAVVEVTVSGDLTVGSVTNMAGGSDGVVNSGSALTSLLVDGLPAITAPVFWAGSPQDTAAAIASAINFTASSPEYDATSIGPQVNIIAKDAGAAANGRAVSMAVVNGMTLSTLATTMAGGADGSGAFTPGTFVRTIKSKMYSVSDSLFHFSGIGQPTRWKTDAAGAGFVNMATQNSGSEELTAVARYQNLVAIFSPEVVQVWFVDPDPALNVPSQVLSNTGTSCPQSVTQFGDSDLFYLDESGLRSLRARDSSNAASTTDIGVPVDDLIAAKLAALNFAERQQVVGIINPIDKRFWLIVKDEIFVFSFYQNAKVSAWSTYELATHVAGVKTSFTVQQAVVWNRRVYLRGGNRIYAYGGTGTTLVYDETEAEAWLPYLDANRPTAVKDWQGVDVALTGLWEFRLATQPIDLAVDEVVARVYQTTYNMHRVPYAHSSSHISPRLVSKGAGPAVLSGLAIHFAGKEDET
jgi:sugar lactone lactonase YvrE